MSDGGATSRGLRLPACGLQEASVAPRPHPGAWDFLRAEGSASPRAAGQSGSRPPPPGALGTRIWLQQALGAARPLPGDGQSHQHQSWGGRQASSTPLRGRRQRLPRGTAEPRRLGRVASGGRPSRQDFPGLPCGRGLQRTHTEARPRSQVGWTLSSAAPVTRRSLAPAPSPGPLRHLRTQHRSAASELWEQDSESSLQDVRHQHRDQPGGGTRERAQTRFPAAPGGVARRDT